MKNRTLYLMMVLLLIGGGLYFYLATASPSGPAKALAPQVEHLKPMALVEEPCPVSQPQHRAPRAKAKAMPAAPVDYSLQGTIDRLNNPDCLPFPKTFLPSNASKMRTDHQFQRTKQGFVVNMRSRSVMTTPTFAGGYLYTSGGFNSRNFYAINTETGQARWAVNLGDDGPSSAVLTDSAVIFNTESCTIFALNRFTGKHIWSRWIGDPLLTHPVTDGKLVFTSYPGLKPGAAVVSNFPYLKPTHPFVAMNAKTGDVVWQRWLDGDIMTTPIVHGDDIYLTTFAGSIYRLSKDDGKILAAAEIQATSLPTLAEGHIYTTQRLSSEGHVSEAVVELDLEHLQLLRVLHVQAAPYLDYEVQKESKWTQACAKMDAGNGFVFAPDLSGWQAASALIGQSRVSALQNYVGSTLVHDGGKLYSTLGHTIVCIDIANGTALWQHEIKGDLATEGGHLATMPIVAGNYVVSVTHDGQILLMDKSSGEVKQTFATRTPVRNQPILIKGRVIVPSTNGSLTCIDTHSPEITGWSMFLKNNAHDCSAN